MSIAGTEPGTAATAEGAASTRVADYLRTAILSGDIIPGEWIRQEEVAERLGSSRLPVREALRILEAEGLTEHEPHRGARVPRLSMHEVEVIYRMRERLEQLAIAESIPRLDDDDVARLQDVQERLEANTDVAGFLALDREFHLLSYGGCPIEQLTAMVTRLWNSTQHYRRAFVSLSGPGRRWVINAEHRLLLDAIVRRDVVDAERFLGGHIRRTRIELNGHPELFDGGDR
ncbi:GntR family transcriptional regulator [Pseudonocardia sp.]|jgi:DNA-binding GntR family transcriptional regulator|uniref:GntR family transcriptional regulator n=1 Tax=Pseudonocardia sp. TaxID=60912 RepID=UPI0031FC5380